MSVEASQFTLYPPPNSEMFYQGNGSRYEDQFQTPMYGYGETNSFPASVSRKRSRDSSSFNFNQLFSDPNVNPNGLRFNEFASLSVNISSQIYQQQSEIDLLIAHHTEKVRSEIDEMRKRNTRRLIASVHETIMKRLKTKEDEILKIGQMNWSLEEKLKSLSIENQILKELVQANEATANALRNKLQQVLAQIQLQQQHHNNNLDNAAAKATDAQSYCGSNYEEDYRQVAEDGGGERNVIDDNDENEDCNTARTGSRYGGLNSRRCRKCEKEESCVLLLPCRHLCVCRLCVSSVSICPVCNSAKSAGVQVNMSSSYRSF